MIKNFRYHKWMLCFDDTLKRNTSYTNESSDDASRNIQIINNVATTLEISTAVMAPKNIKIITKQTNKALPVESQMPIDTKILLLASFFIAELTSS